jgi:hypothetical protein
VCREPRNVNDGVWTEKYNFFHSGILPSGDDMYPYLLIDLLKPYAVVSVSLLPRIEKGDGVALIARAHNITVSGTLEVSATSQYVSKL